MDKVFREKDLTPKLKDLKAKFGFKPMITGSPVTMIMPILLYGSEVWGAY